MLSLLAILLSSCDDFGSLNNDPNSPSQVRTELLLTNAETSISDAIAAPIPTLYVQYIAETQYTDDQEYRSTNASFNGWYTGPLQNLQTIIDLNSDEATRNDVLSGGSNNNQIAVARILKVYFYQMMTDRWGMIPYSEALQGSQNFAPSYDRQMAIYEDLFTELEEAVTQIDDGPPVNGDILFSGDMDQWVRFANSLRARAALRLADAAPEMAEAEFTAAYNAGLIDEDVLYPYLAEANNENPWYTRFQTRTDYAIHITIADYMKELEDHRILKYANPAPNYSDSDGQVSFDEIRGMPFLLDAGELTNDEISFPGAAIGAGGPSVGQQDAPLPIITVAEMNFAVAEAIERGWVAGSAAEFYESGIRASWQQWGVYDEDNFAAYMAQPEVEYGTDIWQAQIGTQKWVALFPSGYEAWSEWRRLGYPELEPNPFGVGAEPQIPARYTYPSSETNLNSANYEEAVDIQGPDTPATRVEWDVE